MRDFDLIPFDEGTDVLAAPSLVAVREPRKSKKRSKRNSSSRKVTGAEPQPVLRTENLAAIMPTEEKKSGTGLWLLAVLIAAFLIVKVI